MVKFSSLSLQEKKMMWELQGWKVRAFSSWVSTFSGRREASKLLRVGGGGDEVGGRSSFK